MKGSGDRIWEQKRSRSGMVVSAKWNKIEHRLFPFISINWRAKPLTSLETVIELISHTTTKEGLQVTAIKDSNQGVTVNPGQRD